MDLGQRIRRARKNKVYTQAHLATLLGVNPLTIDRWEGAICTPAPRQLAQLDQVLDLQLVKTVARNRGMAQSATERRPWPWHRQEGKQQTD